MELVVPSLAGSSMRMVLRGSGSGRMLTGCASFSMTTIFHCSAGSVWRWMDSIQHAVRSGRCSDGMTMATVFTQVPDASLSGGRELRVPPRKKVPPNLCARCGGRAEPSKLAQVRKPDCACNATIETISPVRELENDGAETALLICCQHGGLSGNSWARVIGDPARG